MKKILFVFILTLIFLPVLCSAEQININTATLSQLDELIGIGPAYAQKITDGRPYSSVDDLLRVKGIGPATLQKIKIQGWACVNCEITQQTQQTPQTDLTTNTADAAKATVVPVAITVYPIGVFINEILPSPKGADEADEWIELYNSNNSDVDLSGWKIQDTAGTVTNYTINPSTGSGQAKILANGFLVLKRPDTKIMLNNDGDGLNLLTPDDKIVDMVLYTKAPLNQSYNKTSSGWQWSTILTPGAVNKINAPIVAASVKNSLPKAKNSDKNNLAAADLSNIGQNIDKNQDTSPSTGSGQANPWFLFFIALAVTIILAAVVLFIKLKLKNHVRT